MSLKHILLGMLEQPMSGYDLKQMFEMSLKNFWNAELSQIYPLLSRLEQQGYVESHVVKSDQGPDRRVYRLLQQGEQELIEWLEQGPRLEKKRVDYLAQMFFLDKLPATDRLAFVRLLRKDIAQTHAFLTQLSELYPLDGYKEVVLREGEEDQSEEQYLCRVLTIHHGVMRVQAVMDWCDLALKALEGLPATRTTSAGA